MRMEVFLDREVFRERDVWRDREPGWVKNFWKAWAWSCWLCWKERRSSFRDSTSNRSCFTSLLEDIIPKINELGTVTRNHFDGLKNIYTVLRLRPETKLRLEEFLHSMRLVLNLSAVALNILDAVHRANLSID